MMFTRTYDRLNNLQKENAELRERISEMTAKCEDYDRMKSQHQSLKDEIDFLYKRCNNLLNKATVIIDAPAHKTGCDAVNRPRYSSSAVQQLD